LPRGRHKLPAETVRGSQRARIVRAMLECVGRDGYEGTTVPQVSPTARVSRNAFYEFFATRPTASSPCVIRRARKCFGELLELAAEPDWVQAMRRGRAVTCAGGRIGQRSQALI